MSVKDLGYAAARRVVVAVVGATLLLVGLVLLFTPGPAVVVLGLALAVFAAEFAWARRWLRRLRETAESVGIPVPDEDDEGDEEARRQRRRPE